ncbi:DUF3592 domain-containing protein [Kitasatospora sp. NPDC093558]|uniref:DUF3592 domain-containing protein n=1 Tax=Kitasatospora sp. NPDC093558 TaxID=3155201 RepID=UPI0034327FF7
MHGDGGLWVALVVGVGVWVLSLRSAVQQVRAQRGTVVVGTLLRCFRERTNRGGPRWKGVVRFQAPEGGVHRMEVYLSRPGAPGGEVIVCYPPGHPQQAREAGGRLGWQFPIMGLLVGTSFVAAALLILSGVVPTSPVPPR